MFFTAIIFAFFSAVSAYVSKINPLISSGPSQVDFVSQFGGLDALKVQPINATSWDWWYFDALSWDGRYFVNIIFFAATSTAFPLTASPINPLTAVIELVNGDQPALLVANLATEACVDAKNNVASGTWEGTGLSFSGNSSGYQILLDMPTISGSVQFIPTAPGHYSCSSTLSAGQSMELFPHVGWSNAIPDANTLINLEVNGSMIKFAGTGYHDKNWGDKAFNKAVKTWYWGRGRVGPYSVVWFDSMTPDGVEYSSGYVALDGTILASTCSGVKVRPFGDNSEYPPPSVYSIPDGFNITMDLGKDGMFSVQATITRSVLFSAIGGNARWTGTLSGGFENEELKSSGLGVWEQFAF